MQFVSSDSCIAFLVPVSLDVHKSYFLHIIISKFHVCKLQLHTAITKFHISCCLIEGFEFIHTWIVFIPFHFSKIIKKNYFQKKRMNLEFLSSSLMHSSLVDYLAQVEKSKNYPTHSDCVLSYVWVYMSTTQNIRGCLWSSKRTCFS